jgi:hypothetical protein
LGLLLFPWVGNAQEDTPPPIITAENITELHSTRRLDFSALPAEIHAASGQFVANHDALRVLTFGNHEGEPPLSQAILWGYSEDKIAVNAIDGDSIARYLTDDGLCLYTGYLGYIAIWQLDPELTTATLWHDKIMLASPQDSAVNFWFDDDSTCTGNFHAEIAAAEGELYRMDFTDETMTYSEEPLFTTEDIEFAARVGRIAPPLALTLDFDGTIYRWDMMNNTVKGQVNVGQVAMFGKLNHTGTHYVWQAGDRMSLQLVDFTAGTNTPIVELDYVYISHILLANDADVVIGVDPDNARGTVHAWTTADGKRYDLGTYRDCERVQPDLVKLSDDGTSVIIGCDTGIDIWHVGRETVTN